MHIKVKFFSLSNIVLISFFLYKQNALLYQLKLKLGGVCKGPIYLRRKFWSNRTVIDTVGHWRIKHERCSELDWRRELSRESNSL
jgi:hypothetical protein